MPVGANSVLQERTGNLKPSQKESYGKLLETENCLASNFDANIRSQISSQTSIVMSVGLSLRLMATITMTSNKDNTMKDELMSWKTWALRLCVLPTMM